MNVLLMHFLNDGEKRPKLVLALRIKQQTFIPRRFVKEHFAENQIFGGKFQTRREGRKDRAELQGKEKESLIIKINSKGYENRCCKFFCNNACFIFSPSY